MHARRRGGSAWLWGPAMLAAAALSASCAAPAATGAASSVSTAQSPPVAGSGASPAVGPAAAGSAATGTAAVRSSPTTTGLVDTAPPSTTIGSSAAVGDASTPLPQCRAEKLRTLSAGKITFTAPLTARPPWFVGNDPARNQGFESAVAYAVAARLGFPPAAVGWVRDDPAKVILGSAGGFDAAIGELKVPATPGAPVDYSTGYFSVSDAVVVTQAAKRTVASSVAGLRSMRLGVVSGSTARTGVAAASPGTAVTTFASDSALIAALRSNRIDAAALDAPTAWAAPDLTVVGLLPAGRWQPDQLGMALPAGSALTSCVSAAIDSLRAEGTLTRIAQRWLPVTVLR